MDPLIALVDSNDTHRDSVKGALTSLYRVKSYHDSANAIAGMLIEKPKVILVGQKVGSGHIAPFLRDLKREPFLAELPIVVILDNDDYRHRDLLRDLGIRSYLVKPYPLGALLKMIAGGVSRGVEEGWKDLSSTQRKALDATLSAFNSMAENIASGNPLAMNSIDEGCAALVEVVSRNELSEFLHKMRHYDNAIFVHALRSAAYMALFARSIGLPTDQQTLIASGGMLHDIGMLTVPKALITKTGKLTPGEVAIIRGHVASGEKIIANSGVIPRGVAVIVTQHHERLDGSGYPRGLVGTQINQLGRMAGIIDAFTALTGRRPYRRTVSPHVALEMIATEMKQQFDGELLARFRDILLENSGQRDEMADIA